MILTSSVAKKQIVALTGFLLIIFIFTHLGGNLLIYAGPDVFNCYARNLHALGPLLWIPRAILLFVFVIHITVTFQLVIENIRNRGGHKRYILQKNVGNRSFAETIMPYSGLYIFIFVIFHVRDFALKDQHGIYSFIHGKSYGLYGIVFNAFSSPVYGLLYIFFMCFLGLHLSHAIQSMAQTAGFRPRWVTMIKRGSDVFAWMIAVGFSSIPVYVYWMSHVYARF